MIKEFKNEYEFLSNFYPFSFIILGIPVKTTVEHMYQAYKVDDPIRSHIIMSAATPGKAKRLGQQVKLRPNWEQLKVHVIMKSLLQLKFSDPTLRAMLLSTGDEELQEGNTWGDTFWGVDLETGEGENHLGNFLWS